MNENFHPAVIEMRGVEVVALQDAASTLVENVDWSVAAGEFWVIAGQQYSGKSDLLLHAAGLMTPTRGTCRVFGCDTGAFNEAQLAERLRVGFVFTGGKLFNQLTVAENVALPLRYQENLTAEAAADAVGELLDWLELTPFADATPTNLAASWRQRAALARALALKPELLLLDNPLTGLGVRHRQWLLSFLDELGRGHAWLAGRPMTLVVATDDLRPWRAEHRKFALLANRKFIPLGGWRDLEAAPGPHLKELLAEPAANIN